MDGVLGVDFGTTNTVVSLHDEAGQLVIPFDAPEGRTTAFRSVLSFGESADPAHPRALEAGPWAIERYLEDPRETRFIQSFKTFAASPLFQQTEVFSRRYTFEDLLGAFLLQLKAHAGERLERIPKVVVVGRPVAFAGASADADLALRRYEGAFRRLGVQTLRTAYEPVAAAFYFAQRLQTSAVVLVADFGGGTSDFSVIRFDRRGGSLSSAALGHAGAPVAGDAFDYRLIDAVVSPELGKGSTYQSFGKVLPVPTRYYAAFARWSQLAIMRSTRDFRDLKSLARTATDPRLSAFVELIEDDHGFPLYRAVSRTKEALSLNDVAPFRFQAGAIDIKAEVRRQDFERWIAPELAQIERALEAALGAAQVGPADVDQVFLTGGSSFVPAVRRLFTDRFSGRVATGGEFVSIASGLGLMGQSPDLERWSVALA